jgi:hypothetical protein
MVFDSFSDGLIMNVWGEVLQFLFVWFYTAPNYIQHETCQFFRSVYLQTFSFFRNRICLFCLLKIYKFWCCILFYLIWFDPETLVLLKILINFWKFLEFLENVSEILFQNSWSIPNTHIPSEIWIPEFQNILKTPKKSKLTAKNSCTISTPRSKVWSKTYRVQI